MTGKRSGDAPADTTSFLVVADPGNGGWGIAVARVDAVLDSAAPDDALDAARFGFPGDRSAPARVIRLRAAGSGCVVVRGRLAIVDVARAEVHALPPLIAATMTSRAFSSVALVEGHPAFLVLDVDLALREPR
jgi:hypothetical protein